MQATEHELCGVLERHFGYRSFREGQLPIISRVLSGQNVLGILSTGGGKSITYQLPALVLPGLTLVVSPLISLMIDQVQQLRRKGFRHATYLNSALTLPEIRQVLDEIDAGRYKLLYISPEKLQQPQIIRLLKRRGVSLVAVDEAHCISQWGHDFRTDYLRLPEIIAELGSPPLLAVTATATQAVQEEISHLFHIRTKNIIILSINRPNIAYDLIEVESDKEKREHLMDQLQSLRGPGIVYCSTRQSVDSLVEACHAAGLTRTHTYHGGMNAMERMLVQEQFMQGQLDVIIATNAFGMGIDKGDIRYVLHYHVPASIEAYTQEIGRIGRDGQPGYACLYVQPDDQLIHHRLIQNEFPTDEELRYFVEVLSGIHKGIDILTHQQIQAWVGVGETVARMLFFYAERAGLLQDVVMNRDGYQFRYIDGQEKAALPLMRTHLERTKQTKYAKLQDMQAWLTKKDCLRKTLTAYFGEAEGESEAKPKADLYCCCYCGLDQSVYMAQESDDESRDLPSWDLEAALRMLFPKR
ncbi:RecQ family ATP-dependent DNA helicase [Brevibacillus dissolubilis]|uniref:RecQ family ATP-dependent DNA helicase n=1 Tax=Brevibacillus dissolubilis TaxID=1844116 RepID=UPI00111684BE|nr:ATP-dependent DNA helicase RecQ [Brevibacillus dissolubilis]